MPDEGSTFTLELPVHYAGAEQAPEGTPAETDPSPAVAPLPRDADFGETRVLIVDDDMRNIFAIRCALEARGFEVIHAENGKKALEVLNATPNVNLVLMDTMMPEMDGLSATRAIRDIVQFQALPIISLTAKAMKGDREKALEAGASDYVTKPVDPEHLLAVIYAWRRRATQLAPTDRS